jgi:hypothetical protein
MRSPSIPIRHFHAAQRQSPFPHLLELASFAGEIVSPL